MNCGVPATFTNNVTIGVQNDNSKTLNVYSKATFTQDIEGTAVRAKWADLAEMYEADHMYDPGTLVKFGGDKEITAADGEAHGVITSKPGLILNGGTEDVAKLMLGVALTGRVPVLVKGVVTKGDKIVLSDDTPGVGQVRSVGSSKPVLAIALNDKQTDGIGLVECVTKIDFGV